MINNKINKTYLNVKYSEKDTAKKLGAKWGPNLKKWYAPNNEKVLLEKWGLKNKIKLVEDNNILESLLCFNYYAFNVFFSSLNNFLGETSILILGPLLFPIIFSLLLVCNNLYLVFLWFEKMSWFFKKNVNNAYEGRRPEWRNVSIFEPINNENKLTYNNNILSKISNKSYKKFESINLKF